MAGKPGRSGRPKGSFAARPTPRVAEALILHTLGLSFAEIGRRFGVSRQAIHQSVVRWAARSDAAPAGTRPNDR